MKITERTVGDVTVLEADGRMTRNEGYGVWRSSESPSS